jgi:DNA-binding NarL/FixJ family response regulator
MISMVHVAIVDDHESVRLGLKAACSDAGYEVVATASNVD